MRNATFAVVVAALGLFLASVSLGEAPVYFADPNLQAAVEAELGLSSPTPTDMLALTSLIAESSGIVDLTGLEHATNLWGLLLYGNQISDISALTGLTNLTSLDMGLNQISDISPLSGLTNLERLGLYHNQISDISPLSGLTNLKELLLDENQISDISPLSGLTNLTRLLMNFNQIGDISTVAGLTKLLTLELFGNQISDVSMLAGLTGVELLGLGDNQISDISVLGGLGNLTELGLGPNQISDISALASLTNLTVLALQCNQIGDFSVLAGLTNLKELALYGNQISDITVLSTLTNLRKVYLGYCGEVISGGNQISDISVLAGLTDLTHLYLWGNQVSDISALAGLTNLTYADLRENLLNTEAYITYIPLILADNPAMNLLYDAYDGRVPVYRFWSPLHSRHFYTSSESEKVGVIATYPPSTWTYEGIAFYAYPEGAQPAGTQAVHRFWSPLHSGHFYTINAAEKDSVIATYPSEVWTYEGIAFYAYPEGAQPPDAAPVHRFWSSTLSGHFYTISEAEKDYILATYPTHVWQYEAIAWYAYEP